MNSEEIPEKKKRGRKPKSDKNNKSLQKETDNLEPQILHLNITRNNSMNTLDAKSSNTSMELYNNICSEYNTDMQVPNAYNEIDNFSSKPFEFTVSSKSHDNNNVKILLKNIDENQLTNIACYWCCHKFNNPYLGMPIKYKNNAFEVNGCFCSFECMCAYNFYSNENNYNVWEIYNLINIMANAMNYDKHVYPAPPRKCLSLFGGYMSIDEFRNFKSSKKIINVNTNPFVINVEQIEEINDFNHKQVDMLYGFDKERLSKLEKKIKHQNELNIQNNYKNTLDSSMNIAR